MNVKNVMEKKIVYFIKTTKNEKMVYDYYDIKEGNYMKINKTKRQESAKKAWETMKKRGYFRKKDKKVLYNNKVKDNQRNMLINLLKVKVSDFDRINPLRDKKYMKKGIYLESPSLLFTKKLEKEHLTDDIFFTIPNHIEFDKFNFGSKAGGYVCNAWGQARIQYKPHKSCAFYEDINNVVLSRYSYNDTISRGGMCLGSDKWQFVFIWGDYCGAFSSFVDDIDVTFDKKLLGNGSIYALTFNKRDMARKKKLPNYNETNCIVAVIDYVTKSAKKNGYKVTILPESGSYKSSMYTAIFEIEHKQISQNLEKINEMYKDYNNLTSELYSKITKVENAINE